MIGSGTQLPPVNPQLVNRVVGYLEYSQALTNFDRLLEVATPSELSAMQSLIEDHPEFTIYTNLSQRFETGPTMLSERPEHTGDDFAHRGLDWMMALARVELGAMAAGFTTSTDPF